MQIRQATLKDIEALLPLYEDLGYPTITSSLTRGLDTASLWLLWTIQNKEFNQLLIEFLAE